MRICRTACLLAMVAALSLAACGGSSMDPYPRDDEIRVNQLQSLGTHNSYHRRPRPNLFSTLMEIVPPLATAWEYDHAPFSEQFSELGIRQVELDVFADPEGGRYADPAGARIAGTESPGIHPEMHEPGFKVFHVQDLDFESTCWTLRQCLREIRDWSDANPHHSPILILIEAKDEEIPDPFNMDFVIPLEIGPVDFDALDAEIREVIPEEKIVTPDEVRGDAPTLREAIVGTGWPTLRQVRGRLIFALDNGGRLRDAYLANHAGLEGRVLFVSAGPDDDLAAFQKLNDSVGDGEAIERAVDAGLIVRTRADGDTTEARDGDTTRRDAAIASGAQFVSTDYPVPNPDFGTGYFVEIPGGTPSRCNPRNSPGGCVSSDIE